MGEFRDIQRSLMRDFGFQRFRPGQRELIAATLEGRDALGVLPTGGGKSLTYQLPAMALPGLTLVVSPLIALMKDQVDAFNRRSRKRAVAIHSNLTAAEAREALALASTGEVSLMYVAPERLVLESFRERVIGLRPRRLVIDEAHCVNQWGHDFRPAYLALAGVIKVLRPAPVIALTATATPATRQEIVKRLGLSRPSIYVAPFDRPNLSFEVVRCAPKDKAQELLAALENHTGGGSAIIYVGRRADTDDIRALLSGHGFGVVAYHAGMDARARRAAQDSWLAGETPVVVATVAFGMGIDKPDVRIVLHYQHPSSLESYYQEAGRAGRDGDRARCILLFSSKDTALAHFFIRNRYPTPGQVHALFAAVSPDGSDVSELRGRFPEMSPEQINVALLALEEQHRVWYDEQGLLKRENRSPEELPLYLGSMFARKRADYKRLESVQAYGSDPVCHRAFLLRYFGERVPEGHTCGNCSSCLRRRPKVSRRVRREEPRDGSVELILWKSRAKRYLREDLRRRQVQRKTGIAVLTLVAGAEGPLAPSVIANLLRGSRQAVMRLRRPELSALSQVGSECSRRYDDVLEDVLSMWAKGYLAESTGRRRGLEITASGRGAISRATPRD